MNNKKHSILPNKALRIVLVSAITGGLIALQDYANQIDFADQSGVYQSNEQRLMPLANKLFITDLQALEYPAQANFLSEEIIEKQLDKAGGESREAVLFELSSSEIAAVYFAPLLTIAEQMKTAGIGKKRLWQIVGHADPSGNSQFNSRLAQQRAQAVADFLVHNGVDPKQLSVLSLGDSSPVQEGKIAANNTLQRRVEIHPYQAEVAALAAQLNERMTASNPREIQKQPRRNGQKIAPLADLAAAQAMQQRGFEEPQQQPLMLTSAVIQF